ncbi:hypothetical protein DM01DRAFT_1333591 [Hesseltinella vesiculosa]|uniref:C2H2-type domain-containing protein n=1 Tax=Hesseltinella vesiculosa TaxID=101127 RepID=A0A1X2GRV3_9FUNG|nr:hypothetical protein DM01DRAFT_1333591 [Hesseltinella vesiculosa]
MQPFQLQDVYANSVNIENRHATLLSLIDAAYPPDLCCTCYEPLDPSNSDHLAIHPQKYRCLSALCQRTFTSRACLRFHVSTSHLIDAKQPDPSDPLYLLYATAPSTNASSSISTQPLRPRSMIPILPATDTRSPAPSLTVPPARRGRPPKPRSEPTTPARRGRPRKHAIEPSPTPPLLPTNTARQITSESPTTPPFRPSVTPVSADPSSSSSIPTHSPASTRSPSPHPQAIEMQQQERLKLQLQRQLILQEEEQQRRQHLQRQHLPDPDPSLPYGRPGRRSSVALSPSAPHLDMHRFSSGKTLSVSAKLTLASYYPHLQCPSCKKYFKNRSQVVRHLQSDHGPGEGYQCYYSDCPHTKAFSSREGLVYHLIRTHHCGINDAATDHPSFIGTMPSPSQSPV